MIIGPMLRHVSRTSATIFVETDQACTVDVLGRPTPTFSVGGHHYALVIVEDLEPGSSTEYEVRLNGDLVWPPADSQMPPSAIRTLGSPESLRVVFGSCRTAAPHEPPWNLEMIVDLQGRGVDAMYAHGLRMMHQTPDKWPDIAVFLGDQVYADDSSPKVRERIIAERKQDDSGLPPELVGGFEEYTWLYHEAWSQPVERWFFSVVPSVMIFDDHEMIDDWNISDTWVHDIHQEPWWRDHVNGGLMTYWIYQHLGNLSPDEIRAEGILDRLHDQTDGTPALQAWADSAEEFSGVPGGYRFSFWRDLGPVRLVVADSRNSRSLKPGHRRLVHDDDWNWIVETCRGTDKHLLFGTSLPAFVPGGMHDLQVWSERVCDGAWGSLGARVGEKARRAADMEDWPAFSSSFDSLVDLIAELGARPKGEAPITISVLSGDIHFSYAARIHFPPGQTMNSHVHQLVNSPIRNALRPHERTLMRVAMSRFGSGAGRVLRRGVRRRRPAVEWEIDEGPVFQNCLGLIEFTGDNAHLVQEHATPDDDGNPRLTVAYELDLDGVPT